MKTRGTRMVTLNIKTLKLSISPGPSKSSVRIASLLLGRHIDNKANRELVHADVQEFKTLTSNLGLSTSKMTVSLQIT